LSPVFADAPINILFSSGMHTPFLKSAFARRPSLMTFAELQQSVRLLASSRAAPVPGILEF
jgi:hypothetical protein